MLSAERVKELALSFPEALEAPHFENTAFKVSKKIFATLNVKENRACLKLSEINQDVFSAFDRTVIYPVPNKWGKQGWTLVDLSAVNEELFMDALTCAWCEVAAPKLVAAFTSRFEDLES